MDIERGIAGRRVIHVTCSRLRIRSCVRALALVPVCIRSEEIANGGHCMTSKLLTNAVAAAGLSLIAAGLTASGHWDQPVTAQTSAGQRGDAQRGGEPAGQPGADAAAGQRGRGGPVISPGPAAARFPKNADEFDQMFNQVKNWSRWGKDDQLGTANLITDAKRKQAFALVKSRLTVSLAHNPLTEAAADNGSPFE